MKKYKVKIIKGGDNLTGIIYEFSAESDEQAIEKAKEKWFKDRGIKIEIIK